MNTFAIMGEYFITLITPMNIFLFIACSFLGIVFGCLPGLTASIAIALLTGLTYGTTLDSALIMLLSSYVGAIYGGSISAVLIGIPGTGSAAATVLDGHPLALKGEGAKALSLATIASFFGTLFGILCLALFTPLLLKLSLNFTSVEYTLLSIFGISICGTLTSAGKPIKGWISGFIGLFFATIGFDPINSYPRFTFGIPALLGGVQMVPAMIGLFGIPCVFVAMANVGKDESITKVASQKSDGMLKTLIKHWKTILRSGVIGSFVGAIPGVGEDIAAWLSYDIAKKSSKNPEEFGKGAYEGIVAAETGNNACIGGAMIPLLSLGVPGSGPCAVLLGALTLHGIRTGPMLAKSNPEFIPQICTILIVAAFFMRFGGLLMCKIAPKVLSIPTFILMPIVATLCVIGSYAIYVTQIDITMMFVLGLVGFAMDRLKYPAAPAVLGLILGNLLDSSMRRSLIATNGSLINYVTRPIAMVVLVLIIFSLFMQTPVYQKITAAIEKKIKSKKSR